MIIMTPYEIYKLAMTLIGEAGEPRSPRYDDVYYNNLVRLCDLTDYLCEKICEIQRESTKGEKFQRYTKCWIEETIKAFKDELDRDAGLI